LGLSVILTAPHAGHLIVLAAPQGKLAISVHTVERVMGVAVARDAIAFCGRTDVWLARNAPDIAAKLEPRGRYDACYLTRAGYFTGDLQGHEAAWVHGEVWLVNTAFSCLCSPHPLYNFVPRWRPPFITELAPEDRCHLNGLAVAEGRPRYVTAVAETNAARGWRSVKGTGGCLIDVASNQVVVRGLCMPHSPRVAQGRLYLLDSGTGRLVTADAARGGVDTVAVLPGFAHGLAVHDGLAFVGLSRIRATSDMTGLPIAEHPERLRCGLVVVDLSTGQPVAHLDIAAPVNELFDVQLLMNSRCPFFAGPHADRDHGHPLWTVPPAR
jgi:uncharacterized protein (TIGR03032 family)